MAARPSRSWKPWVGGALVLLIVAGGAWAFLRPHAEEKPSTLPPELSLKALKAEADHPAQLRQKLRENLRSDKLTEAQRRELFQNMREVMRSRMRKNVDEYLAASDEDKNGVLDRQIDEMREQMKRWRRAREEDRGNRDSAESQAERQKRREEFRKQFRNRSQQERKKSSESRNPDQVAQRMAYFQAMRKRARERGIDLPMFGGGHRSGRGAAGR